jgi:PAS domain S-box-containing protein
METIFDSNPVTEEKALELFRETREKLYRQTDRWFANLMIIQWLAGIAAALVISPKTWIGAASQTHLHVWIAIFLGGTIAAFPVFLAWKKPGSTLTRHTIAVAQMLFSALLIHLTGGRLETHFHIFGSLAFLAFYRDWKVLVSATIVVAIDHFARGVFWPQSVFGILTSSSWRWLEHAGWVVFEDTFLLISIRSSLREMYEVAARRAKLEAVNSQIESQVVERTLELLAAHQELQGSEQRFSTAFEQAAIGMALVGLDGRWLKANRALCHSMGYSAEELYGKTFQEMTHPDDLEADLAQVKEMLTGAIPSYQMEKRYYHKDGRVVWTLLNVSLIRDTRGQPVHLISQIQDITSRRDTETRLENVHKQLMETSRQAGMAEVATSVLHNVGNVLNSVNVCCSVISDKVRKSRVASVGKAADLLKGHAHDLGAFFASDPAGQKLPDYLCKLGTRLSEEQATVLDEVRVLAENIGHIKEIVAMQQDYARISGVTETINVIELVEDSLRMNAGALTRHEVQAVREYSDVPPITIDKHKVLQILVNLIRNAKYACDESGREDKQMTLRVSKGEDRVRISVIDNGVGIPAENLSRIFAHGFTTRKDGHGFGLHSAVLAAQEMGARLAAQSEGPGKGATFTLDLPLAPASPQ